MNGHVIKQLAWLRGLKGPREPPWLGRTYVWRLFVCAIRAFLADDCTTRASVIAYATLLSLFPTLLVVLTVIGYVIADPQTQADFIVGVASVFPGAGTSFSRPLPRSFSIAARPRSLPRLLFCGPPAASSAR